MSRQKESKPVSRAALAGEADPRLVALSVSIEEDRALYEEDIRGSRAHLAMLAARGIVPKGAATILAMAEDNAGNNESLMSNGGFESL